MSRIISILIIGALVGLDRACKIAATAAFKGGEIKPFLFGLFQLRYVENTGAAFSAFSENTVVLTVFTVLAIALCLFILLTKKTRGKFPDACLILIISGGIGNAIDRIVSGYVVDYIEPLFMNFAVFNVADIFITVGAAMLIIYEFYLLINEKKQAKENTDKQND